VSRRKLSRTSDATPTGASLPVATARRPTAHETVLERLVRLELERRGVHYRRQARVGRYTVDFLVGRDLVLEADGQAWHPDLQKAAKNSYAARAFIKGMVRDQFLTKQGLTVVHLDERAIRSGSMKKTLDAYLPDPA
jgi:very-short-patch-repair endonuclease